MRGSKRGGGREWEGVGRKRWQREREREREKEEREVIVCGRGKWGRIEKERGIPELSPGYMHICCADHSSKNTLYLQQLHLSR